MSDEEQDIKADIETPVDRGEIPTTMEPLLIRESSAHRSRLADLAVELTEKSTGLSRSLPPQIVRALATMVRSMNCYYSNLIEGHDTHPVDIERALKEDYSHDPKKRDLQLEAEAHIEVQQWLGRKAGRLTHGHCDGRGLLQNFNGVVGDFDSSRNCIDLA